MTFNDSALDPGTAALIGVVSFLGVALCVSGIVGSVVAVLLVKSRKKKKLVHSCVPNGGVRPSHVSSLLYILL